MARFNYKKAVVPATRCTDSQTEVFTTLEVGRRVAPEEKNSDYQRGARRTNSRHIIRGGTRTRGESTLRPLPQVQTLSSESKKHLREWRQLGQINDCAKHERPDTDTAI